MIDERFHYGAEQHRSFEDQGFFIFEHFLSEEALATCSQHVDGMLSHRHPDVEPDVMISTHLQEPLLFALATQPKLLDLIEYHIGPNILLWASHLLCKPPNSGHVVPWHQDAPYFNFTGQFAPAVWIPFDDIDEDNGAMSVVPGWHKKGKLPTRPSNFPDGHTEGFNKEILPSALPDDVEQRRMPYLLNAGQMAIHNSMIPHSSPPNRSHRWRRVLVLLFVSPDGQINGKTYKNYKTGEPFEREFILVRGEDIKGWGLRRNPFETAPAM